MLAAISTLLTRRGPGTLDRTCQPAAPRGVFSGNDMLVGVCEPPYAHCDRLWTFPDVAGAEPTNIAGERTLCPAVIRQKLSFGT